MVDLVGAWKLDSYIVELNTGEVIKPRGDDFIGITLITENRFMCSSIMRSNVEDSFFSYTGHFDVEGNVYKVLVELCSVPSWVGTVQERVVEVDGDQFTAVIPEIEWEGIKGKNILTWKRMNR